MRHDLINQGEPWLYRGQNRECVTGALLSYEREGINYFWSIKNSTKILNKLKTKGFQASTISTYDFSTLYTTLPHNLIRNQLVDLIENTFRREEALYLACNEEHAFFASEEHKKYDLWSCQKGTDALIYLLDNIYIRFGSKLYRQNVGIPMGTNCAPLVADLFLFCYERDFMKSLTKEKRYDLIDAFNSTSRYLDDLLNTLPLSSNWSLFKLIFSDPEQIKLK